MGFFPSENINMKRIDRREQENAVVVLKLTKFHISINSIFYNETMMRVQCGSSNFWKENYTAPKTKT